jgi:membrane protease YdiL (CAAX protease family)
MSTPGHVSPKSAAGMTSPLSTSFSPVTESVATASLSLPSDASMATSASAMMRVGALARSFNHAPRAVVLFYVGLLVLAEFTTFLLSPALGMVMYGVVLLAVIVHASVVWQHPVHRALLSLTFVPIIRLVSLAVPLGEFPLIQAYTITGVPLIIAAVVSTRSMKMRPREVGLALGRRPLLQLAIIPTGLLLGVAEYLILRPEPMATSGTWPALVVSAIILLVCTGFAEEFMFRGIMQETMRPIFGTASIVLVSLLFAALHVGYRSALDLLVVLSAGLMFGVVAYRCHSIWTVTLAHGLTNIVLFLVCPAIVLHLAP